MKRGFSKKERPQVLSKWGCHFPHIGNFFRYSQHANTLALGYPREKDGACIQMRLSYSLTARLFLFLVQWTDCNLAGALGLLRILIYLAHSDGKTTMSIYERNASITDFDAAISDHAFFDIKKACNFSVEPVANECDIALGKYFEVYEIIDMYSLYARTCNDDTTSSTVIVTILQSVIGCFAVRYSSSHWRHGCLRLRMGVREW